MLVPLVDFVPAGCRSVWGNRGSFGFGIGSSVNVLCCVWSIHAICVSATDKTRMCMIRILCMCASGLESRNVCVYDPYMPSLCLRPRLATCMIHVYAICGARTVHPLCMCAMCGKLVLYRSTVGWCFDGQVEGVGVACFLSPVCNAECNIGTAVYCARW